MTAIADTAPGPIVRWHYLGYSALALAVMTAAITSHERWFLNFVHVISGVMWTGIDLFMGFVMGPILRRVDLSVRREIIVRLVPKTLFLMPTPSTMPAPAPPPLVGEGWGGGACRGALLCRISRPPPPTLPTRGRGDATGRDRRTHASDQIRRFAKPHPQGG